MTHGSPCVRRIAMLGLATASGALSGCILLAVALVGAVAVGTYKYVNNELQREYDATVEQCHEGARRAAKRLNLQLQAESYDFNRGTVETRMADGRSVTIRAERLGERKTLVSVRVGDLESDANRSGAQQLHEQLYKELTGKSERVN